MSKKLNKTKKSPKTTIAKIINIYQIEKVRLEKVLKIEFKILMGKFLEIDNLLLSLVNFVKQISESIFGSKL